MAKTISKWAIKSKRSIETLTSAFGWKFLCLEMCVFCFIKGFVQKSTRLVLFPYFNRVLQISGNVMNYYYIIIYSAWGFQPWLALVSRHFPILGYKKRYYILCACILGVIGNCGLGFIDLQKANWVSPIFGFFIFLQVMVSVVLSEIKYIEICRKFVEAKPAMLMYVMINTMIGSFAGNYVGEFTLNNNPQDVFKINIAFSATAIFPIVFGFLPEEKTAKKKEKNDYIKRLYWTCFFTGFCCLTNSAVAFSLNRIVVIIFAVATIIFLLVAVFRLVPKKLAKICLFVFIFDAFFIRYNPTRDAWLLKSKTCLKNAPSFSISFLKTHSQFFGNFTAILASIIFKKYCEKMRIRSLFIIAFLLRFASIFPEFLMVFRVTNGLGDQIMFIFSNEILISMAFGFSNIGIVLLIIIETPSDLICPIVFGFDSIAYSFSMAVGAFLTDSLKIVSRGEKCDFSNFWILTLISRTILPLFIIPAIIWVIPREKICDKNSGIEEEKM